MTRVGRVDHGETTRAAIAAVQRWGREAAEKVPAPVGVSEARWRAMLRQIQLYGPPTGFRDW